MRIFPISPSRVLVLVMMTLTAGTLVTAAPALASSGSQYGTIGQYGEVYRGGGFDTCWFNADKYNGGGCSPTETQPKPGEFVDPVGFTVDTKDPDPSGSGTVIYVLDRTSDLPANVSAAGGKTTTWRLQKLSATGTVLGVDRFSLPADTTAVENNGTTDYEMFGLAVDPTLGRVYALETAYNANTSGDELVDQILAWSTTPNGSGQLVGASGLPTETSGIDAPLGIGGYPSPAILSNSTALTVPANSPLPFAGQAWMQDPTGLAIDTTGGTSYVAVQAADATEGSDLSTGTNGGIITVSPSTGAVVANWSSNVIPVEDGSLQGAGLSVDPTDNSLTWLDDEADGAFSDLDIADVPANLTTTPTMLADSDDAVLDSDLQTDSYDDASVFTADVVPETYDDGTPYAATATSSPQVVALSNGLFAGVFEPDPDGQPDPQSNPAGLDGLWTPDHPGIRLLQPDASGLLSEPNPPLDTLFDTLGSPSAGGPCSLTDAVSAGAGAPTYPSLAAGSGGAIWVLTNGQDSSGAGNDIVSPQGTAPQAEEGGRQLIELAPGAGTPCPTPSGTFAEGAGGTSQPANSPTPLTVQAGTTVSFDASGISYHGAATAAYAWNFGDGSSQTVLDGPDVNFFFLWPSPTITHEYTTPGAYTVTLKLSGDFGTYVETGTVDVLAASPPLASFTVSPPDQQAGQPVTFDGSASNAGSGGAITQYEWTFGDGQTDVTSGPTDTHVYAAASSGAGYSATLVVRTNSNATSAPVTVSVPISAAPTPTPTPTTTTATTTSTPTPAVVSNAFKVKGLEGNPHDAVVLTDLAFLDPGTVKITASFTVKVTVKGKGKHAKPKHETKTIAFGAVTRSVTSGINSVSISPDGAALSILRTLNPHSSLTVGLHITFTPTGGTAATQTAGLKVAGLKVTKKKKKQ